MIFGAMVISLSLLVAVWSGQRLKSQTRPGGITVHFFRTPDGWRAKYFIDDQVQYIPGAYPRQLDALREMMKTYEE